MKRIASLHLLENGNTEVTFSGDGNLSGQELARLCAVCQFQDDPELIALLDRFVKADKAAWNNFALCGLNQFIESDKGGVE
jgi:hypothetical protein